MNVIGFHNPEEEFGFLSNWYLSDFVTDGIRFSSMEQFMMYRKAMTFEDRAIASEILQTEDVARIKELGRLVSGYEEQVWNGVRQILIYEGLLQKFAQNEDLKRKLLDTGDSILAECAVKDQIWGIGLSMKDPNRLCPSKWKGQSLFGYSLMITRDRLREKRQDSIRNLQEKAEAFRDARNWKQFHNPKDLAISISLEAAELLEVFQWSGTDLEVSGKRDKIREELADVLLYCGYLASDLDLDISEIVTEKLERNDRKYPIDKAYGTAKKYTEL